MNIEDFGIHTLTYIWISFKSIVSQTILENTGNLSISCEEKLRHWNKETTFYG